MKHDTQPKFTPGPLFVNDINAIVEDADGVPTCKLLWPTTLRTEEETRANANLYAIAPEMYEELASLPTCGCGHPHCNRCGDDRRRAAILAKARGESC